MAAFFALLAGLAIGSFAGMLFVGVMIGSSGSFRKLITNLCMECEDKDI